MIFESPFQTKPFCDSMIQILDRSFAWIEEYCNQFFIVFPFFMSANTFPIWCCTVHQRVEEIQLVKVGNMSLILRELQFEFKLKTSEINIYIAIFLTH